MARRWDGDQMAVRYGSDHALGGFKLLTRSILAIELLGMFIAMRQAIRYLPLAIVAALTVGGVISVATWDLSSPSCTGGSECWRGVFTALAIVAAALVWVVVLVASMVARYARRRYDSGARRL